MIEMNTLRILILGIVVSATAKAADFYNLGFDAAITNNIRDADGVPPVLLFGTTSEMLPGWNIRSGSSPETRIGYNVLPTGFGIATLYDANNGGIFQTFSQYFLALYPSTELYSLSQSGQIPSDAMSIRFTAYGGIMDVTVNGTPVNVTYDSPLPVFGMGLHNFAHGVADISAWAGQTVDIQFGSTTAGSITGLDDIYLSPIPVDEPPLTLFVCMVVTVLGVTRLINRIRWNHQYR